LVIEAILCNGDKDAAISSADPGGGPVDGNKVEPGLLPEIGSTKSHILPLITIELKFEGINAATNCNLFEFLVI